MSALHPKADTKRHFNIPNIDQMCRVGFHFHGWDFFGKIIELSNRGLSVGAKGGIEPPTLRFSIITYSKNIKDLGK
jgi:hypothetical protein